MIKNINLYVQWLKENNGLPEYASFSRLEKPPSVNSKYYALSSNDMLVDNSGHAWLLFQPPASSVNESFDDYPEEIKDTFLVLAKIMNKEASKFWEDYSWYECTVVDIVNLFEIPKKFDLDEGEFELYSQEYSLDECYCNEYKDFITLEVGGEYQGEYSLFIKVNDQIFRIFHRYWPGSELTTCYNQVLTALIQEQLQNLLLKSSQP